MKKELKDAMGNTKGCLTLLLLWVITILFDFLICAAFVWLGSWIFGFEYSLVLAFKCFIVFLCLQWIVMRMVKNSQSSG